jgi:hypothetical protein
MHHPLDHRNKPVCHTSQEKLMTSNIRSIVTEVLSNRGIDVSQGESALAILERRVETGQFNKDNVAGEVSLAVRDAGLSYTLVAPYLPPVVDAIEAEFIADATEDDIHAHLEDVVSRSATAEVVRALLLDAQTKARAGQISDITDEDIDAFLVIAGLEDEPEPEVVEETVTDEAPASRFEEKVTELLGVMSENITKVGEQVANLTEFARRNGYTG